MFEIVGRTPYIDRMVSGKAQFSDNDIDNIHQFEALFNFATIGIVVTNNAGKIVNFNKYAETQFGYKKDEVLGATVDILLPLSAQPRHEQYRQQYYHHPEPRIMGQGRDLFAQNKDGKTFPVEVSLSHYAINDETFVIAFIIDITVRKADEAMLVNQTHELNRVTAEIKSMNVELEEKVEDRTKMLREALAELERSKAELNIAFEKERELNELKSRFVAVASHEFRTPLSTILSSVCLVDKYTEVNDSQKVYKHVQRIKGAVDSMKTILEDFLSLGKMEEGLVHPELELVGPEVIDSILKDLLEELESTMSANHEIKFANTVSQDVLIDRNLTRNVLINLLSNAIKFTESGGHITVKSCVENDQFIISVEDTGIGISAEDQQHLFERFFRAKNAAHIQGTGLGLHIVAKYLELINGTITISSKLNEGTTVSVYIPQLQPKP